MAYGRAGNAICSIAYSVMSYSLDLVWMELTLSLPSNILNICTCLLRTVYGPLSDNNRLVVLFLVRYIDQHEGFEIFDDLEAHSSDFITESNA